MYQDNNKKFFKGFTLALKKVFLVVFLSPSVGFAIVTDATLITKGTSSVDDGFWKRFSLQSNLEYSASTAKPEMGKREESVDVGFVPMYKINDDYKLVIKAYFYKPNTEDQKTQAADTVVSVSRRGFDLGDSLISLHSAAMVIPTSDKSRRLDRLQTAASISNGLHYAGPFVTLSYRLGYTRYFHEYDFNAEGEANIKHSIANSLGVQINLTDKVYLTGLGLYRWGQVYANKERSSFEFHGDINFDVTPKVTLNLGTSNTGQALKANGVTSNISAFNENTSVLRAGILMSM